jgi:hypothetical protein
MPIRKMRMLVMVMSGVTHVSILPSPLPMFNSSNGRHLVVLFPTKPMLAVGMPLRRVQQELS